MKGIATFPRNGLTKAIFPRWSRHESTSNSSTMAASPGTMYQKQLLKKRPTSYLQPSSGSLSKADRYKEKDIPLNSHPPPSPTIQQSNISLRKFSQISVHSDASDAGEHHTDANSNSAKPTGATKNAIRAKYHQVRYHILGKP